VALCSLRCSTALLQAHLYSLGVIHCDIKASNVLLKPNERHALGHAALADFGLATSADKRRGTYRYMAPEVAYEEPNTPGSDVYSFGLMLWELIHTRVVWQHLNGRQALMQVVADPAAMQPPFEQQGPPRPPPAECDILSSANSTSEFTTKVGNGVLIIPFNEEGSTGVPIIPFNEKGSTMSEEKVGNGVPMIEFTAKEVTNGMPFNEAGSAMSEEGNPWPKLGGFASREYEGGEVRGSMSAAQIEVAAQHPDEPALQGVQWEGIVELVRQCWELEAEERPSAVHLEAQLRMSMEAIVGNTDGDGSSHSV